MVVVSPLAVVLTFIGPLVLVPVVLMIVFAQIRRVIDRDAAALAGEGIELDSGRVTVTTRYRRFRTSKLYRGGGIRRTPARLVLTRHRLHILERPQRYGIIDRAELHRFTVGVLFGALHLSSSDPPGASGSIDYRVRVPDVGAWVAALAAAGARRESERVTA